MKSNWTEECNEAIGNQQSFRGSTDMISKYSMGRKEEKHGFIMGPEQAFQATAKEAYFF